MIQGKYLSVEDDLSDVFTIRKNIFIDEMGKDSSYINEGLDALSIHATVTNEKDIVCGSGRLTLMLDDNNDTSFSMDLLGVLPEERHKGYGEFLVRILADKAMLSGAESIKIECNLATAPFFEKLYFKKDSIDGDVCKMHVDMADFKHPCEHCK